MDNVINKLRGEQWEELGEALMDAFRTEEELRNMLQHQMDLNLERISLANGLDNKVFDVIQHMESRDITYQLIDAARHARPTNQMLILVARKIGTFVTTPSSFELEKILSENNQVFDVDSFLERIGVLDGQVCRIEIGSLPCGEPGNVTCGTGFLVGPQVVLTNHHVIKAVKAGNYKGQPVGPADVTCRFDYKRAKDGVTVNAGKTYKLAEEWLIADSPYSEWDRKREADRTGTPELNELDFAFLRLDRPAGNEKIGGQGDNSAPARGFVQLPMGGQSDPDFAANKVMFIMQHPLGDPLKLTVNTFRNYNANKTRVTYLNDTDAGSSGSPCFDGNWNLVALHHSGDPSKHNPEFNQGIPIQRIASYVDKNKLRGKIGVVGASSNAGSGKNKVTFD